MWYLSLAADRLRVDSFAAMSPPPAPFHLIRKHQSPLSALSFSPSNTLLYSADQGGYVAITDLRSRRVIAYWKAHGDGVLGVEEWEGRLIRCDLASSPYVEG